MENKAEQIKAELIKLKANAYDISKEINRYTGILQQVNARIEELTKQLVGLESSEKPTKATKKT